MSRTERHNARVRRRVLDAWGELLAESGYGATTVAEVATRAGLARSSVYRYFPDKELLFFAYVEDRITSFVEALRTEVAAEPDAARRLRRLVVAELRRFADAPAISFNDIPDALSREGRSRLIQCFEPLRNLVREILEQGQQEGSMGTLAIDDAIEVVFACIDVFRVRLARQWVNPDEIADDIADFVLRGLSLPQADAADAAGAGGSSGSTRPMPSR